MKNILKLTLAVVCVMGSTSLFAQKIGRISSNEIVYTMPETLEAQKQVEAFEKELQGQYETITELSDAPVSGLCTQQT